MLAGDDKDLRGKAIDASSGKPSSGLPPSVPPRPITPSPIASSPLANAVVDKPLDSPPVPTGMGRMKIED
jgi:hypothetical protein